jgi:hypothetical protein
VSVYGAIWSADEDHPEDCGVWVRREYHLEMGDGPCTCGLRNAPIVYRGSHILPADTDGRGGHVSVAGIPGFITRDGRDDRPDDDAPWPYLRVSVGQEDAVLDEGQVCGLRDALSSWLGSRNVARPSLADSGRMVGQSAILGA